MVSIDVAVAEKARLDCNKSKKYRIKHPEKAKEYSYTHREEKNTHQREYRKRIFGSMSDVEIAEMARKISESNRKYRQNNLEKKRRIDREYQRIHKEERRIYDKEIHGPRQKRWKRERRVCTTLNGKSVMIKGILKRPYPNDSKCELCNGEKGRLVYHHWEDTEEILKRASSDKDPIFLKGIWVCQPCNNFVHRLTEFPYLAEAWFALKGVIDKKDNSQRREDVTYPVG